MDFAKRTHICHGKFVQLFGCYQRCLKFFKSMMCAAAWCTNRKSWQRFVYRFVLIGNPWTKRENICL